MNFHLNIIKVSRHIKKMKATGIELMMFQLHVIKVNHHATRKCNQSLYQRFRFRSCTKTKNLIQLQIRKNDSKQFLFPHQSGDRLVARRLQSSNAHLSTRSRSNEHFTSLYLQFFETILLVFKSSYNIAVL